MDDPADGWSPTVRCWHNPGAVACGPGIVNRYGGHVASNNDHLRWTNRPDANRPVLVVAFEGWNDAGSAATTAVSHVEGLWGSESFCDIDPEEFMDFSETRPTVFFDDDGNRTVHWPENRLSFARVNDELDVITLLGIEPQLRWRTFCDQITSLAIDMNVSLVVVLGALLAEVPHTRPTPVYGTAYDPSLALELSLTPSSYEGPTGIVGVLHDAFRATGIPSASLWAAVPTYIPNTPSPKAALALAARLGRLLHVELPADELSVAAAEYEQRIDEVLADDEDSADWVSQLEVAFDSHEIDVADGDDLIAEVERFLRNQR
jgi:proteasome assembly chaperone (PAC2) family protein